MAGWYEKEWPRYRAEGRDMMARDGQRGAGRGRKGQGVRSGDGGQGGPG